MKCYLSNSKLPASDEENETCRIGSSIRLNYPGPFVRRSHISVATVAWVVSAHGISPVICTQSKTEPGYANPVGPGYQITDLHGKNVTRYNHRTNSCSVRNSIFDGEAIRAEGPPCSFGCSDQPPQRVLHSRHVSDMATSRDQGSRLTQNATLGEGTCRDVTVAV